MGQLLSSSALHSTLTQAERLLSQHQPQDALDLLKPLLTQYYQHVPFLLLVGLALYRTGKSSQALLFLQQIIKLEPNHFEANKMLAELYHEANNNLEALTYINKSLKIKPKNQYIKEYKSMILSRLNRYEEAINIIEKVVSTGKPHRFTWNNLAQLYQHTGQSKQAKQCLEKSIELSEDDDTAYNNLIVLLHYLPNSTQEQLKELLSNWECKYAKHINTINNLSTELTSNKKLRIGMISDGFRAHPVGQMITSALEALPQHELELYTYSTNLFSDAITERIKEVANHWMTITHLNDEQLANQLVEDKIDILFDLCGHNNGSRMQTMAMKPAPILVKWVGGLINTTGLSTMDYLLSDHIETPSKVDDNYTEKLIRLPDDYICYNPPLYTPNTVPPPALHNNFITLGCFNNTAKLNPELLSHWARIMHDLPQSKLLLKSFQINSEILCNNIKTIMGKYGINEDRLLLEGPATHEELLKTYNKVDIALDPWPYSGGLTTCEALFMGVPVVTLPGPTFAGRHSATHLTNVGLGQLVAEDWQQYHDLVVNLASDLENLANIRQHLRTALLESPVCDAPRFARNFSNAMRAIWQRHCEGKKPAALSLDKDGNAQFADEEQPVVLQLPEEPQEQIDGDFSFNFTGRINALEHGATLASRSDFGQFLTQGAVNYICLDPGSAVNNSQQLQHTGLFEYFPLTVLGDGSPLTLALAVDATQSTTLPITAPDSIEFLSTTPVASHRLDDITGLDNLDWLILDGQHDNLAILENGKQKLADALLIEVAVSFLPDHAEQVGLDIIQQQLTNAGFELLKLDNAQQAEAVSEQDKATSGKAIFVPTEQALNRLDDNQLMKLSFLLDAVYSEQKTTYQILQIISEELAKNYSSKKALHSPISEKNYHVYTSQDQQKLTANNDATIDWQLDEKIAVVDIGANPIDGRPPYFEMLKEGMVSLVGFEPQQEAIAKLNKMKGPNELYLPYAVGDGKPAILHLCHASGMTSTLKPNFKVLNQFQGYPVWAKIKKEVAIDTVRLDDLDEVKSIDWLKIDIQGGELTVFKNAEEKLKNTLVIQTEANFIQLYENQPLFAEIDQWMRSHGFILHTLLEERKRLYAPMVINNQIHQGINQLTTADAVYIKDHESLELLSDKEKIKMAYILHHAYQSYDITLRILSSVEGFDINNYIDALKSQPKHQESNLSNKIDNILSNI